MYCNNCGYSDTRNQAECSKCGAFLNQEPPVFDVSNGKVSVSVCKHCGVLNISGSVYCRGCGGKLPDSVNIRQDGEYSVVCAQNLARLDSNGAVYKKSPGVSLLEKLDMMEQELKAKQKEAYSAAGAAQADELDEHEEALNNIAFKLDVLLSDLLKAEAQQYAFSEPMRADKNDYSKEKAEEGKDFIKDIKKNTRNIHEIIVLAALIAAIFLVGMTFGLWGSYFFGI